MLLKTLWVKEKIDVLVTSISSFSYYVFQQWPHQRYFISVNPLSDNFRLFQTERVCRQQLQIWRKWQKVIQMGRKHCGKGGIARYEQFLPFPQCFQKACFPGASKGVIVWEWVKFPVICTCFQFVKSKILSCGKWLINPFPIMPFWDHPEFKEAADDKWNVAIKGF